jgi:hypothetical protein
VSLTLGEEHKLRVFETRVLRIVIGCKRQELIGVWGIPPQRNNSPQEAWKKFIMRSFITSSSRRME